MWQLFAAAVAASTGLLAGKHIFFKPTAVPDHNSEPPHPDPNNPSSASPFQSQPPPWEINDFEEQREGTIFRFSSEAASGQGRSGTQFLMRMKTGSTGSKKKKGVDAEAERSNGVEQRRTARRGVGVCLKRRKTGKNVAAAKCGSSSSKGYILQAGSAQPCTNSY
ncbi:uncharacterized protein LOC103935148 isoform X2 [Pyrus x bretschneideri]|uniref:uncharacterized protein LOC103935148 isoform X2 n=1 Tax=Pyrus x bretschneideri TaxID=225117 RepID=UPI00202E76E7|nr:uncharacterized protein LOC103935148 isoform X2 [Pyrus x bretschneideri]